MSENGSSGTGQSRRRWLSTTAMLAAGSATATLHGAAHEAEIASVHAAPNTSTAPGNGATGWGDTGASLVQADTIRCTRQLNPSPLPSDERRFTAWNKTLRAHSPGRETAFVDLDALDYNLKRVDGDLGPNIGLRLVAKSLPCVKLLEYMLRAACTNRVMAFSEGMVHDLLAHFGHSVDILLGRPATADAAARVFAALHARGHVEPSAAAGVRWLVDTPERMGAFATLADKLKFGINVAIEIDVGLRRGGARNRAELLDMLDILSSSRLNFTGFMGYEGHVPFAPMAGMTPDAEFAAVQQRYTAFVQTGREAYPEMFDAPLVFNSGGSRTYHYYSAKAATPVNEVALGSAFFYPSHFHNLPDTSLRAAAFLATPVLKRIEPAETPFDETYLPKLARENTQLQTAFFMTGGDFPGEQVFPTGLRRNVTDDNGREDRPKSVVNMLPNQGRWLGRQALETDVGDFIFYQPWEADAIRWLKVLDVFRGARLVDQWPTFQPGVAR